MPVARITPEEFDRPLSAGQVAARSGVAVSTVHFYEAKGLVRSWRSTGNQRRYSRDVLRRVAIIKVAQRLGLPSVVLRRANARRRRLPAEKAESQPSTGYQSVRAAAQGANAVAAPSARETASP